MSTVGLFIGRFQPFHKGHLATVKFALESVDTLVIVIGSAQKSHEERNPFTAGERIMMIRATLEADGDVDLRRIITIPVEDVDVHSLWTFYVDMLVPQYDVVFANDAFTLLLFQERGIKTVEAPLRDRSNLMATEVRRRIADDGKWQELVPSAVSKIIEQLDGVKRVKAIKKQKREPRGGTEDNNQSNFGHNGDSLDHHHHRH